jgi:hypothetical protein
MVTGFVRSAAAICVVLWACLRAGAGPLRDFENDLTGSDSSKHSSHHDSDSDRSAASDSEPAWLGAGGGGDWLGVIPAIIIGGGAYSWQRVCPGDANAAEVERRRPNEPVIPFLRLEGAYEIAEDDIDAFDTRVQAGFGPFAMEYGLTRFKEDASGDRLDFERICGLYRMSFGRCLEIDLGIGQLGLEGAGTTRETIYTTPILIYPKDWWGVEFRPAWAKFSGATLQDYDLGLCLNWRGAGLKVGYRWMLGDLKELSGAYIGAVYRY